MPAPHESLGAPDWELLSRSVKAWLQSSPEARVAALRLAGWLINTINESQQVATETAGAGDGAAELANRARQGAVSVAEQPVLFPEELAESATTSAAPAPASATAEAELSVQSAVADLQRHFQQGGRITSGTPRPAAFAPSPVMVDLAVAAQRLRLKADACRFAADRRTHGPPSGALSHEERERMNALIVPAKKLPDCYLWMLHWQVSLPGEAGLRLMAETFDALGDAVELARAGEAAGMSEAELGVVLALVAECQSALRLVVMEMTDVGEDFDQLQIFGWLREATETRRVFVERHMRLDDPADPTQWEERGRRIQQQHAAFSNRTERGRQMQSAWKKLRYHAKKIQDSDPELARDDWARVFSTVDDLVEHGVRPSDSTLREILLPILEHRPLDMRPPERWSAVLDEIDRWYALAEASLPVAPQQREQPDHVQRVAALLQGARVVLVGGQARPQSREALTKALHLGELDWISSREHSSLDNFAPAIVRPDTLLVLLLIRWSSHSYEGLDEICARHGKVFVRVPGGYSPSTIAHQILEQASDRLRALRPGF